MENSKWNVIYFLHNLQFTRVRTVDFKYQGTSMILSQFEVTLSSSFRKAKDLTDQI